jgi:ubiquinone/menaquinone biosynthesis C-methylase UbiE
MSQSPAARLQHAALRIASQDSTGLDLAATARAHSVFAPLPPGCVQPGQHALLIGARDAHIAQLVAEQLGATGALTVVDSEQSYLNQIREHLAASAQTPDLAAKTTVQLAQAAFDDFQSDPNFIDTWLHEHPITDRASYLACHAAVEEQRTTQPLIAAESFDVVVVNQALHRVSAQRARQMLAETLRVLRPGGRLVVLELLADEAPPANLTARSGTLALQYAPQETEIRDVLLDIGYHGIGYTWRADVPTKVLSGVELRAFVVEGYKPQAGPALDCGHAVIYRGPWREVVDDRGQRYVRGERTAVSNRTYQSLQQAPYHGQCIGIPCYLEPHPDQAPPFDSSSPTLRDPHVTKGKKTVFDLRASGCNPASGCC